MIHLSQRSPEWANVHLGASSLDVAHFGCTTTALAMLSDYFKCYQTPKQLALVKSNYTASGLVLWNAMHFDKMKFVWRDYKEDHAKIKDSINDPKKAVILQVSNGRHWVVATQVVGDDYAIVDPWDAQTKLAKKVYHNVTGASHYIAK